MGPDAVSSGQGLSKGRASSLQGPHPHQNPSSPVKGKFAHEIACSEKEHPWEFQSQHFLERFSSYFLPSAECLSVFSFVLNFCKRSGEEPQENVRYVTVFKTSAEW